MIRLAALAMLATGCDYILALRSFSHDGGGDDAVTTDARPDAPPDPPGFVCVGHDLVRFCVPPTTVSTPTTLTDALIDTDADPRCIVVNQNQGPQLCAIVGSDLTVAAPIFFGGSRPLVLAATGALTVEQGGSVDVSSSANRGGAGVGFMSGCVVVLSPAQGSGHGAGGGAGGSFRGLGGDGGPALDGFGDPSASAMAVMGPPGSLYVRGGCPGNPGGQDTNNRNALGGTGAGGVVLIGQVITVNGAVMANGGGGGGALEAGPGADGGGGGGGSGGLISFDAQTIAFASTSRVIASGGGGGGGTDASADGGAGVEVNIGNPMAGALGGSGGGTAGSGGTGSSASVAGTVGGTATDKVGGGGGGGGGAGYIRWTTQPTMAPGSIVVPST